MKKYIYQLVENSGTVDPNTLALQIAAAAGFGILIFLIYYYCHMNGVYSRKFNITLIMMTVLTATVMTVIGSNIALSLGMVGALSIVRFRTAIKDSRDTVFIFWSIICGICCGVSNYVAAGIGTGVCIVLLLLFGRMRNDARILLVIRGGRGAEQDVESVLAEFYGNRANIRVKNTTRENSEMIYELPGDVYRKVESQRGSISDRLYENPEVKFVNVVTQNDEISG